MVKVVRNTRGGKQRAPRGRGRGKRTNLQNTDLVVTVPNEDSGSSNSRLKPPVTTSQPRKVVRLNRKTGSTDLEKVTVKSLDEIKREKVRRQKESATTTSCANATQKQDTAPDENPFGKTDAEKLTIPLQALPALSSSNCKILTGKQPVSAALSSPAETREIAMDFDSNMSEQDFDYLDSDEDHDIDNDYDEELLLGENEDAESQRLITRSQDHPDGIDVNMNGEGFSAYVDFSDVPLAQDYAEEEEEEEDEISLHPDDSLFDEEDEFSTDNDRVRPRVLGRRSGSESKDLRVMISDRQKQPEVSSSSALGTNNEEPQADNRETENQEQEKDVVKGKFEKVSPQSHHRERDSRWSSSSQRLPSQRSSNQRSSSRHEDERHQTRASRGRGAKRNGGMQMENGVSRRGGRGSRQGLRRESGSNAAPVSSLLGVPSLFGTGNGLLPLPGALHGTLPGTLPSTLSSTLPGTGLMVSRLQAALQAGIQTNLETTNELIKKSVEMLTNPPPVPGEHVPDYDKHRQQPPMRHGSQGTRDSGKMTEWLPPKRSPTHVQSIRPLMSELPSHQSQVVAPSQMNAPPSATKGGLPKWLQRTNVNGEMNQQFPNEGNVNPFVYSSSLPDCDSEVETSTSKRKSPFHGEEMPHGGKIMVTTSPEGLPQPNPARVRKTHPKGYCFAQLDTGHCTVPICKYWHMSRDELLKYNGSQQSGNANSDDHPIEAQHNDQAEQTTDVVQETQLKEEVPMVSYKLVDDLLTEKNLFAAWQMVEKLCRANNMPDLEILMRTLVVCSDHLEEPDIAAQVACKAFDMIGRMCGQQRRHNYTVLIRTLCHSGQYIRAYEMLDVMKRNNHMPTYEVFLDLVQASAKDPDWAFNLLDEIKRSGLFKSGICSDLILLGCNSGEHFIERTWSLFQEALQSEVRLSVEAVSTMLFTLSQTNNWEKIMSVLPAFPEAVPMEILKTAVLTASQKADWIDMIIGLLAEIPAEKRSELGPDVWNTFLSNCCLDHASKISFAQKIFSVMHQNGILLTPQVWNTFLSNCCLDHASKISFAQKIFSVMHQNGILLTPQCTNNYMIALSRANNCSAALDLFNPAHEDPKILEQPQVLQGGLIALTRALDKAEASAAMLTVVHFMLEHHLKPDDSVLQSAVESLDKEKNYKGVHQFFYQLEAARIVPPVAVYRQIVSSLEKWVENPVASCEPYAAMRRAYPVNQSDVTNKEKVASSDKGSFNASNCRFVNPEGGLPFTERSSHGSGASTPGGSVTGSIVEKRPSNPFVLQGHGAQLGGILATSGQVAQPVEHHQISQLGSEALPFASQSQNTTVKESIPSQNQSQGKVCHFFGTIQGCRFGDQCRFIHHQSSVLMSANSNPVLPGGPFSSTWQGPRVHPASGSGSHHFQLAGPSHLMGGTNPFSPSFPGRTRSMDGLGDQKATDQNHQVHSAPVVLETPAVSHFQYPSRKSLQFYLPRIKHASEHNSWEDLGYVYVNMKNEDVEIDHDVLQTFFQAFGTYCPETVGECFEKFSSKIQQCLEQRMPNPEPDHSPSACFDDDDKYVIGQLGVALMYLSYSKQLFSQGYTVLHVLHNFSINYSLYSGEFGVQQRPLTTIEVALTATDICLCIPKPLYSSALEVLRGTNYALPAVGTFLTSEEAEWRRSVLQTLCGHFMSSKEFDFIYELLDKIGDIEVFGSGELKALYNGFLRALMQNKHVNDATALVTRMETNRISREPASVRVLVNGFAEAGNTRQAKRTFMSGIYTGVYPTSFNTDNPWTVTVGISFSAVESQLYIEKHLQSLQESIEQRFASGGVLDDSYYRPLTVVIKSDEVPNLYTRNKYMQHNEAIHVQREKVRTVLTDAFNPPLSCAPQSKDEELIVSAMSLKRWFCANPATGRFKGGSFSWATSMAPVAESPTYLQPENRGRCKPPSIAFTAQSETAGYEGVHQCLVPC
ncbi:testis- and ovary-specific PAZ domain-containing protein 1 [Desmophyllum pertusum]|uniref:Testis- and ovary-specific PAZ domain-containing protein 1 n=1 Tax=Desmophyllum pertusum TaxID=174260 RepID=A0A9W9ZZ92_9CNID|nr:testis- and ovary-specific PAZ domain-containing protein 1 [Desmophyllum pertusum]